MDRRRAARGQGGAPGSGRLPRVEVVGLSKEKVEELFWDTITQVRADLAGVPRNNFRYFVRWMERNRHGDSTLPSWCVMMPARSRRSLERLGHHVMSRRVALGYRNRTDLADSLQFTVRTLADIEHGVRRASPGTYAMLENKLAWAPGSIDTILAGGQPNETVVEQRRPPPTTPHPTPPPTRSPAPPPRSCCWSCDGASSRPATDAARPATTGTTWTRTATGPSRAS